jgi:hypothetical protein
MQWNGAIVTKNKEDNVGILGNTSIFLLFFLQYYFSVAQGTFSSFIEFIGRIFSTE